MALCRQHGVSAGLGALHFAGVGVGIAASAAVVAIQLAGGASWAAMWEASGAVALLGALAVAFLVPTRAELPTAAPLPRGTGADLRLRRMILACGLFGFGYVITATFLVAIVGATPAIRPLEPVIWIVVGLTAAPSGMLWTGWATVWALRRRSRPPLWSRQWACWPVSSGRAWWGYVWRPCWWGGHSLG